MAEQMTEVSLAFGEDDMDLAWNVWGCNCGPASCAAILGVTLADVRLAFEEYGFAEKRYTSPTMMRNVLATLSVSHTERKIVSLFEVNKFPWAGLVRVQWEGPWTEPGANPKWAYRHTHWIAAWRPPSLTPRDEPPPPGGRLPVVFDCNRGLISFAEWEKEVVPRLVAMTPRADGGWHVTHSWEVAKEKR